MARYGKNVRPGTRDRLDRGNRYGGWHGPGTAPEEIYPTDLLFLYASPLRGRLFEDSDRTIRASVGDPVGSWDDASGNGRHALQDTTAKKPTYSATGPSVAFDAVDDLLKTTYALSLASRFAIMCAAWRADGSDQFDLTPMTVTNQTAEKFVNVEAGDSLQLMAPDLWDPNSFIILVWGKPAWASDDGVEHIPLNLRLDANNDINFRKITTGVYRLSYAASGSFSSIDLTPASAWSAGDEVLFALRCDGTDLISYFDTDADGTLNTATSSSYGTFDSGTWTAFLGSYFNGSNPFDGGLNIAILNIGSSATPITTRYNSGDGMDFTAWLAQIHPDSGLPYSEHLVAYLPKSKDGEEVKVLSFPGTTHLDLPGASGAYASVPDAASLDITGDIDIQWYGSLDDWTPGAVTNLLSKWTGTGSDRAWRMYINTSGTIGLSLDNDSSSAVSSGVNPGFTDGSLQWIRSTWRQSDGRVQFFLGGTGASPSWSQTGTDKDMSATSALPNSSATIEVGSSFGGTNGLAAGKALRAIIKNGIGGTTVLDADFSNHWTGRTSFIEDSAYAHTVTINGTAKIRLDPTNAAQLLSNTGFETDASNWTGDSANISQSAAQAAEGSNSLLIDPTANDGAAYPDAVSLTAGKMYAARARLYPVTSSAFLENKGTPFGTQSVEAATPASWNTVAFVAAAAATESASPLQIAAGPSDDDDVYLDEVYLYQLSEPAWTVATKATPSRVIWSATKVGSAYPYVYAAIGDGEKLEIGFMNDAGTRAEASSASAVVIGVHSFSLEMDGSDLVGYVDTVEVARVTLAGTFTGLDTVTVGGMSTFYDGHSFDEKISEMWGHGGVDFPGYSVLQRLQLHNHLAGLTEGLEAV